MELFNSLKIAVDGPVSETLGALTSLSLDTSLTLREELFKQTLSLNLASDGDVLVSRRDSRKKPLGVKLAEDVVSLIGCIKNTLAVPRSLLKNGKRNKKYLDTQRTCEASLSNMPCGPPPVMPSLSCPTPSLAPSFQHQVIQSANSVSESTRFMSVMKDLNLLKNTVNELKKSLTHLLKLSLPSTPPNFCHVRVGFPNPSSLMIDTASLSDLLGCPALTSQRVGSSLKVKIHKECLFNAIQSSSPSSHLVQVWKNNLCSSSKAMVQISSSTIPPVKSFKCPLGKRHIKDAFLSNLCWKSRVAFREWKEVGRPPAGPVYENRKKCKRRVSEYVSKCRARLERKAIPTA